MSDIGPEQERIEEELPEEIKKAASEIGDAFKIIYEGTNEALLFILGPTSKWEPATKAMFLWNKIERGLDSDQDKKDWEENMSLWETSLSCKNARMHILRIGHEYYGCKNQAEAKRGLLSFRSLFQVVQVIDTRLQMLGLTPDPEFDLNLGKGIISFSIIDDNFYVEVDEEYSKPNLSLSIAKTDPDGDNEWEENFYSINDVVSFVSDMLPVTMVLC